MNAKEVAFADDLFVGSSLNSTENLCDKLIAICPKIYLLP